MEAVECNGCTRSELAQLRSGKARPDAGPEPTAPGAAVTRAQAYCAFLKNGACSKTVMNVLDHALGQPMQAEEDATTLLAGGLMHGYQCGMLWGASLAAGARAYRAHGATTEATAAALRVAQNLVASFKAQNGTIECLDITNTDPKDGWRVFLHFFVKGGAVGCMRRIANFAMQAFDDIQIAEAEQSPASGCQPASCAEKLAEAVGASDQHRVMASGFAGGLGLSGSACGALGAAIWLLGVGANGQGISNKELQSRTDELMDAFLAATNYEVECAQIAGQRFDSIDAHSSYVHQGGCAELINALAAGVAASRATSGTVPSQVSILPPG